MADLNNIITALSIDDLVFDNTNFVLQEIQGLEMPIVRLPRYNLPGQSGAFISNALYGERSIKIKGLVNVNTNNMTTFLSNRRTVIDNLGFQYDINNRPVARTMTIALIDGRILTTDIFIDTPLQMKFSENQVGYEDFLITAIAPDFRLYLETIMDTIPFPVIGGVPIPTPIPMSFSYTSGGILTVDNIGVVDVFPIITFHAPLNIPYIINFTSGEFIELNYNVTGDDVIIDCQNQTITQGGVDITGVQTSDSVFFTILQGLNDLGFNAIGGSGDCDISFTPAFLGI